MTARSYALAYEGYWREANTVYIPATSGVYSVYTCRHNVIEKTVTLLKLVYIGESANVRDRIQCHERYSDWRRFLGLGQELCFNFAPIVTDRERVEAALVHFHKPPANTSFVDTFPYAQTTVATSGANVLLSTYFTVYTTANSALSLARAFSR